MFNTTVLHRPLPYEASAAGSVMLSDLSPTNKEREVHETIETADHEYEILDNYNQDIKVSPPDKAEVVQMQPLPSTGDYEFTQCLAYIPVATTSIHSNTNKPANQTPESTQPITAQDDQKDK